MIEHTAGNESLAGDADTDAVKAPATLETEALATSGPGKRDVAPESFGDVSQGHKPAEKRPTRRRKHTSAKKSARYGTTLRKAVPRDVLAAWRPVSLRPNAGELGLKAKGMARPYDLFALRAQSMAYDISTLPMTGIEVQLCADARVDNFGLFRVPGGAVVCDMFDFTHTVRGPWEWDVARLATSVELVLRDHGTSADKRRRVVRDVVREYRLAMRSFANRATMDVWDARQDVAALAADAGNASLDGVWWLSGATVAPSKDRRRVGEILDKYYSTLHPAWRRFVGRCKLTDVMRLSKDMGTRAAWAVTLEGARPSDAVTLLVGEAQESAIQRFVGKAPQPSDGHRIAEGQRVWQAVDDHLLGWATFADADGKVRSYYVRSLWPLACELDATSLGPRKMRAFAKACAWTIAHAHARTGNRFAIAAYLGAGDKFDVAVCDFARLYAAQSERDWKAFREGKK